MEIDTLPEDATRQQIEAAIVEWRDIRQQRLDMDKIAAKLKEQEQKLKDFVISAMRLQVYDGVVIGGRVTRVTEKEVPIAGDRQEIEKYVYEHQALDILQFRLSSTAIAERMGAGETIPGVEFMSTYDLSDKKS